MKRAAVLAFAIVGAALAPAPDTVPAGLLLLADRAALEFATLLATAHVPAGIELREADDVYAAGHPEFNPTFNFDEATTIPAGDLVNAFNAKHCCYRAEWTDGVFVIRPVDERTEFLEELSSINEPIRVTGVMDAARRVMCQLVPSLCQGAMIGGQLGSPETAGFYDSVTIDGTGTTVMETLNQIVRQSPRTWNVVTRLESGQWRIIRYGFIHAHGQRTIQRLSPEP
jgi:hypothetical protein